MMILAMAAVALSVGLPLSAAGCLWDRDTPAEEAIGMPEVVAVLTGRFERNPPLYYEMRPVRVTLHLQLRTEADAWHAERVAFMLRRLDAGRHPDTDASFWEGFTAPPAPELPTISVPDAYDAWQARRMKLVLPVIIGVPMLLSGLAASWWIVRATKARSA